MEDYVFNPVEENNNWPKIIQFMKDIVDKFVIGPSNTQVIQYADNYGETILTIRT